jgi:hypothetical protein
VKGPEILHLSFNRTVNIHQVMNLGLKLLIYLL